MTHRISIAFLLALMLTSAAAAGQLPTSSSSLPPVDYVIGPQACWRSASSISRSWRQIFTVELDGTFSFPLVGRVTARGLTIRQFETSLRATLVGGGFFS